MCEKSYERAFLFLIIFLCHGTAFAQNDARLLGGWGNDEECLAWHRNGTAFVLQKGPSGGLRGMEWSCKSTSSLLKNPRHDGRVMIHFCITNRWG